MPKKGVHLVQTALLDSFVLLIPPLVLRLVLLDSMQMNQSLIIAASVLKDTDAQMHLSHRKNALQVISVPSKVKPLVHSVLQVTTQL